MRRVKLIKIENSHNDEINNNNNNNNNNNDNNNSDNNGENYMNWSYKNHFENKNNDAIAKTQTSHSTNIQHVLRKISTYRW